jgi:tagatose 6-phosphate kinase
MGAVAYRDRPRDRDACVAALARGLRDATPWPVLLADAVALSAAAVAAPAAGAIDHHIYRRLREIVQAGPA